MEEFFKNMNQIKKKQRNEEKDIKNIFKKERKKERKKEV